MFVPVYVFAPVITDARCEESRCDFTHDRDSVASSDAVLFNLEEIFSVDGGLDLPKRSRPDQTWILLLLEAPYHSRLDLERTIANKKGKVAWIASHCNTMSRREEYVGQLARYIEVHVYGRCGPRSCGRVLRLMDPFADSRCHRRLGRTYKFFLAFENSLCRDYATEKFYLALKHDMVPVVMASAADYDSIAPRNSFIKADDFPSPKDLAHYLHLLDANDDLYGEYLKWKRDFRVELGFPFDPLVCDLCSKLHGVRSPSRSRAHRSLYEWYVNESACRVFDVSHLRFQPVSTDELGGSYDGPGDDEWKKLFADREIESRSQ
ncbi:unnamed protein product [Darwinula stevensoni]|uniref:Fucosyltransferase n=1 Tax=Darwinula stevensoni TaxID=69355 RepID=A0A7R9A330_9CRUS|nr:unnamed protein product [Darwinula stevensoni]CAG0880473.1 unnamed protein product [Darwinula stevensoni]